MCQIDESMLAAPVASGTNALVLTGFQPVGGRLVDCGSDCAHIGQAFQFPTDTFELQFQPVGLRPTYALAGNPPPLPPGKHGFNLTPDRTEQSVRPDRRRAQLLAAAGLAQNPVGHAVLPTPFAPGFTPIRLVGHHHFLVALNRVFKFLAVCTLAAVRVTCRINVCVCPPRRAPCNHNGAGLFQHIAGVAITAGGIALRGDKGMIVVDQAWLMFGAGYRIRWYWVEIGSAFVAGHPLIED